MKIAFCGKGGVGKTTLASLLIRFLSKEGLSVLAVDADPACNLAAALDFPQPEKIVPVAYMQDLIHERMGIEKPGQALFKLNPRVADLPEKFVRSHQDIKLIIMGSIEKGGSGCACPASTFLKVLLSHILLEKNEVVVMDMEAGLEHLGRATASSVDFLIIVLEPNQSSVAVGKRIYKLAHELKIKNIVAIANKIKNKDDINYISKNFKEAEIIGRVNYQDDILLWDRDKKEDLLKVKEVSQSIKEIKEKIFATNQPRTLYGAGSPPSS